MYGNGNYFYILSDQQTDADTAQNICLNSKGILAEINDEERQNDLIEFSIQEHIPPGE